MADKIEMSYIEMTEPQANANFGKMRPGRIYRVTTQQAERFVGIGVAKQASEAAFTKQSKERSDRVQARTTRSGEFAALNQEAGASWDTSTHRDVTMAPEEGIKKAFDQGRLVNVDRLTDEEGQPLTGDASLDQILDARKRLGYAEAPYTGHERSSVQGGGSHTYDPAAKEPGEFSTLHGRAPLNAPHHQLTPEQIGNGPQAEADDGDPPKAEGSKSSKSKK